MNLIYEAANHHCYLSAIQPYVPSSKWTTAPQESLPVQVIIAPDRNAGGRPRLAALALDVQYLLLERSLRLIYLVTTTLQLLLK